MSDSSGERIQSRLDPSLFWLEHEQIPNLLTDMDILFDNSFVWLTSRGLRVRLSKSCFLISNTFRLLCILTQITGALCSYMVKKELF